MLPPLQGSLLMAERSDAVLARRLRGQEPTPE